MSISLQENVKASIAWTIRKQLNKYQRWKFRAGRETHGEFKNESNSCRFVWYLLDSMLWHGLWRHKPKWTTLIKAPCVCKLKYALIKIFVHGPSSYQSPISVQKKTNNVCTSSTFYFPHCFKSVIQLRQTMWFNSHWLPLIPAPVTTKRKIPN